MPLLARSAEAEQECATSLQHQITRKIRRIRREKGLGRASTSRLGHHKQKTQRAHSQSTSRLCSRELHRARLTPTAVSPCLLTTGSGSLRRLGAGPRLALLVARVTVEGTSRRELTELVTDHVLADEHGHELAPVVHREGEANSLREDGRAARPGLDHFLRGLSLGVCDLLLQVTVDERPLFNTACH